MSNGNDPKENGFEPKKLIKNGVESAEELLENAEARISKDFGKVVKISGNGARKIGTSVKKVEKVAVDPILTLGKRAFHGLRPTSVFDRMHFIPRYVIKVGVPFLVLFLFLVLPSSITGLDRNAQTTIGIFCCVALLWTLESLPLAVTALLVPALLAFFHVFSDDPSDSVRLALVPFANPVIYLIMGGMIMSEAFRKHGLDRRMAYFLLSKTRKQVSLIFIAMMATAWLFSMWISNTATVALLVPVAIGIVSRAPKKCRKELSMLFLLGIGMGATLGGMGTLVGSSPNAVASALLADETTWTFMSWMKIGFPVALLMLIVARFVLWKMLPVGIKTIDMSDEEIEEPLKKKFTSGERDTLLIMAGMVLMWMFADPMIEMVSTMFGHPLPPSLTNATVVSLAAIFILFVTRTLDWSDTKMLPWDIFFIVGAGLALGEGLRVSGAATWIAGIIGENSTGISLIVLMFLVAFTTSLLTNFVSNTAVVSILVPILITLSYELGFDPKILVMTCALAASISYLTPIGTPPFTIIYGTGLVDRKTMFRTGLMTMIPAHIIIVILIFVYAKFGIL